MPSPARQRAVIGTTATLAIRKLLLRGVSSDPVAARRDKLREHELFNVAVAIIPIQKEIGHINVHFQESVRLVQELIELRNPNWELAVFPVENHGFVEPTGRADEYTRLYKLFDEALP